MSALKRIGLKRIGPPIVAWCAGFIGLAVLVHVLDAPVAPPPGPPDAQASPKEPEVASARLVVEASAKPITSLPLAHAGRAAPRSPRRSAERVQPFRCSDPWRPLTQGDVSLRVRSCE